MLSYAVLTTCSWRGATPWAAWLPRPCQDRSPRPVKAILGNALLVAFLAVWLPILFGLAEPAVRDQPPPADPRTDERIAIQELG